MKKLLQKRTNQKDLTNINGKNINLFSPTKTHFETKLREYIFSKLTDKDTRIIFIELMMELLISKGHKNLNTTEMLELKSLCEAIWVKFINIYKLQGLETAIITIFTHYEE